MTATNADDHIMAQLDDFIRSDGRATSRFAKSVDDDGGAHPGDQIPQYPATRHGLAQFAKSHAMQQLLHTDPGQFRTNSLGFILDRQLVKQHECTPSEVGQWAQALSTLPGIGSLQPLRKAVEHTDVEVEPWNFDRDVRGLAGFLASAPMRRLKQDHPELWRRHHLDFFSNMEPAPLPQDVSKKRHELEADCPDAPRSPMAKALIERNRLTSGQSVLVQNFGAALGDPSQWLRPRA